MPKIGYTEEEKEQIRKDLIAAGLELMAAQGIQHTTVEQIYKKVGISRTFFYSFFKAKEDLVAEALYLQQPKLIEYAAALMADVSNSWEEAVLKFLHTCCYGENNGIAILSVEEQQHIFKRLSTEKYKIFRERQEKLFERILACFGILPSRERIAVLTNLVLTVLVVRRAIPDTLPLLVPEAAEAAAEIQIKAIADYLKTLREAD